MLRIWKNGIPPMLLMLFQCMNFLNLMDSRWDAKTTRRRSLLMLSAVMAVYWILSFVLPSFQREPQKTMFVLLIPVLVFFWQMSRYRGIKFFATFCISDISIAAVDYLAYALCIHMWGDETLLSFGVRDVSIILAYVLMRKFLHPYYKTTLREMENGWWLLCVLGIVSYVFMVFLPVYPTPIKDRPEDALISVMAMAVLELMIVMVIILTNNMRIAQIQKQEAEILQVQLGIANRQMEQIQITMERTALLRHDLHHHLQMLRLLCDNREYDRLREYIDQQIQDTSPAMVPLCPNKTVNLYLNYYQSQCVEKKIDFSCAADIPEKIPVPDSALVVLLGNLLSNALTACVRIPSGEGRWIEARLAISRNTLLIRVENGCPEKPVFDREIPVSQRGENHGYGVASIRNVTRRNGGFCRWHWENGVFTGEIVLPLGEKQGDTVENAK